MTMLSRTPVVVSSPSSSSKKRRRERLCYAKATSSKPNNASTTKTPVPATKKTKDVTTLGENQRRRDVFAVGVLFLSLGGASSSKERAFAYGTGGWKDCEPICDSLKGGFAAQQKLQEEMMRQSMGGGGDDTGAEAKEESKGKKAAVSEREKRKKNLR